MYGIFLVTLVTDFIAKKILNIDFSICQKKLKIKKKICQFPL